MNIPKLRYGIIHSQIGFDDGVSIVIKQIEKAMTKYMIIPTSNIFFLVGKAKYPATNIIQNEILWHKHRVNEIMISGYENGYDKPESKLIEHSINKAKLIIEDFIGKNKIDVLIVHNSSHPVNFIGSIALSRYYSESVASGRRTPKYILWWHDSHLERKRFEHPSSHAKKYLLEGVPGKYAEYIIFINSLQLVNARRYFLELDNCGDYYKKIIKDQDIVPNTADVVINSLKDIENQGFKQMTEKFLNQFKINKLLEKNSLAVHDVQFVLQHTRIVPRKRIDFALRYCHELFKHIRKEKIKKAMIFFVSGNGGDESGNLKQELVILNRKLSEKYKTKKFFLLFAEDFEDEKTTSFKDFPCIFAGLGGIATYFSEVEGFGNNLLEVMSAGLIPAVYAYPVYKKDIAKYKFNTVCLTKYEITDEFILNMINIIRNERLRVVWANKNIQTLKNHFSDRIIATKLKDAIISKRHHM